MRWRLLLPLLTALPILCRAAFLPDVEASLGEQSTLRSLADLGLKLGLSDLKLPLGLQGLLSDIPRVVGPYNVVDVRAGIRAATADRGETDAQVSASVGACPE